MITSRKKKMNKKSYILKVWYNGAHARPYYGRISHDGFEELYNPEFATAFATAEEAMAWATENTTIEEYISAIPAADAIAEFRKWADTGLTRGKRPLVNKDMNRMYNGEGKEDVLQWRMWARKNDGNVKFDVYRSWPDLYSVWSNVWGIKAWSDDEDASKWNVTFEIFVRKNSSFDLFNQELNYILPMVTVVDDDGWKELSVFDHYLCEGGNKVEIFVSPDGTKFATGNRWGRSDEEMTMEELFNYLKKERWYE
jgi:hypothetical protein